MIKQRQKIFAFNLFFVDLLLTVASFFLAYGVRRLFELEGHTVMPIGVYFWMLAVILPTWAVLLPAFRIYSEQAFSLPEQFVRLSKAIGLAWLVVAALQFFVRQDASNRLILIFTLVLDCVLLLSYRLALFRFGKRRGWAVKHIAIVGSGDSAHQFARRIEDHRDWGLELVGVFDEAQARTAVEQGDADELIFVIDRPQLDLYDETFLLCEELGVTTRVVLNFFPHSNARIEFHELAGFPLLTFSTAPSSEVLLFVRRLTDVVLASILMIITLPVMIATALAIKLSSPGTVLFAQKRCGLHGRPFVMYKFRSMAERSDELRGDLEALNEMDGPVFKSSRDPRVTRVGKVLRRFSIDEIPQLINVLHGDMSLVGPRPPLPDEVARYERWQRRRLSMKPGMTCLWQISGRNQVSFEEWMKLDLNYIDNWSLLLDLKILVKTIPAVLLGRGAK